MNMGDTCISGLTATNDPTYNFPSSGPISSADWNFNVWTPPNGGGSFYGNTQQRQSLPNASSGAMQLNLDTYNPSDPNHKTFVGSEAISAFWSPAAPNNPLLEAHQSGSTQNSSRRLGKRLARSRLLKNRSIRSATLWRAVARATGFRVTGRMCSNNRKCSRCPCPAGLSSTAQSSLLVLSKLTQMYP